MRKYKLWTELVQPDIDEHAAFRSLAGSVERGSTTIFHNVESVRQRDWRDRSQYGYGLYGTPTTRRLEHKLALIEDGRHCLLLPSGLGAISLLLLALLKAGERVLLPANAYAPAIDAARLLEDKFGIQLALYDPLQPDSIAFTDNTRLLWVETPGSVSMEVADLPALAARAHQHQVLVAVDATWAAGIALPVFELGADISLQALTKYQSGASDVMMGSLVMRDSELYHHLLAMHMHLGFGVSPEDCNIILRSLPHYKLRYLAQDAAARSIATWLAQQPAVATVLHPALEHTPGHDIWRRDFSAAASLFSIILQPGFSQAQADACINRLQLFRIGYGWGGSCSLAMPYDMQRLRRNWPHQGQLIRLYIGLEERDDLIADLAQALSTLKD